MPEEDRHRRPQFYPRRRPSASCSSPSRSPVPVRSAADGSFTKSNSQAPLHGDCDEIAAESPPVSPRHLGQDAVDANDACACSAAPEPRQKIHKTVVRPPTSRPDILVRPVAGARRSPLSRPPQTQPRAQFPSSCESLIHASAFDIRGQAIANPRHFWSGVMLTPWMHLVEILRRPPD